MNFNNNLMLEINKIAYLIGVLEGKARSIYVQGGIMENKAIERLSLLWERKCRQYLHNFNNNSELSKHIKQGLLEERYNQKAKGLRVYSERVVKSKRGFV